MPIIKYLFVLALSIFMFSAAAQEATAPVVDAEIESRLDEVLNTANSETSMQELEAIQRIWLKILR